MGAAFEESSLAPAPPSPIPEDPSPPSSRFCCFYFPCFRSHRNHPSSSSSFSPSIWERVGSSHYHQNNWWIQALVPLKKLREWSELIAGPRWKTFIRRVNRHNGNTGCCGVGVGVGVGVPVGGNRHGKYNYDPLSYALNFDEGHGQKGDFDEEDGFGAYRNFSARFAAVPGHSRAGSADLLKGKEVSVVG